jgi:hypothetical protein
MPQKKRATKTATKRRAKKAPAREYKLPRTVAELGIGCAVCGQPGEWFDYERGRNDTRQGVLCGACPRSANSAKVLTNNTEAR